MLFLCAIIHSFSHLFDNYLLGSYYVTGSVLSIHSEQNTKVLMLLEFPYSGTRQT